MTLAPGARVGPYEIVAPLGAGGMGEVYRARDARLNRDVAIKTLPPLFANDPERLARFEREARTLAALSHPNIAQIYGLEVAQGASPANSGITALVMELVAGESLDARIARGPLPLDEALAITRQIADGLEAAHEKGIVHRDLKPANVMVSADGDVKVLDFGLARAADPPAQSDPTLSPTITSPATQVGVILGTAAYMSPEQAKGRVADKRSDVWALGCVLYEMLTGRRAFEGEDLSDTLAAVLRADPDWTRLPAATPPHVTSTIQRCLTKDRRARIPDASVVRFLIDDAAASRSSGPALAAVAPGPRSRARRILPLAAAAVIGAVLAAAIIWPLLRNEQDAPRPLARFRIDAPGLARVDVDKSIAISPDGRYIVYEAPLAAAGQAMMLRPVDSVEWTAVPGAAAGQTPFFSPDSKWLGFVTNAGEFRKMPVDGGAVSTIGRMSGATPRGVAWGDDGTIVFGSAVSSEGLLRMPASGGRPESFTKPDVAAGESAHRYPRFLPGGKALVYTSVRPGDGGGSAGHRLMALDLRTNRAKPLVSGSHAAYIDTGHLIYAYDGSLRAVPFDAGRLEVTGEPFTVFDGVSSSGSGAMNYDVSSRGALIYAPGTREEAAATRTLVWVDRDGREEAIDAPARAYLAMRVSADGTRAVLDSRDQSNDLWVWDFARHVLSRLTFERAADLFPAWSPDGRWVVYRSVQGGPHNLFRRRADGTGTPEQLSEATQIHTPTDVTRDAVIFTDQAETHDIMMIPFEAQGGERRVTPLVRTGANERNGTVSPDGRWLAYESDQSGETQVYVRPYPDTSSGQWQISPAGGAKARWSHDGRELFYVAADNALMSVPVTEGTIFQPGAPRKLFAVPSSPGLVNGLFYDVMPGARRFVMLKLSLQPVASATVAPHIIAVLDWKNELRRRSDAPAR